jgi:hypothetical protein
VHGVLWQDWTTVRLTGATNTITQTEAHWLDVDDYRDVVFWLEVKQYSVGGAVGVLCSYETSPSKDDVLFRPMNGVFLLGVTSTPYLTKVLEKQNPSTPLSKWIRWRLFLAGTPTGEWGATFRIHCSLNASRGGA